MKSSGCLYGLSGQGVHFLYQSQLLPAFLTVCNAVVLRGFYVAKKLSFIFAFYKCEYSLIEYYSTRGHLIESSFTNEIIITIFNKLNIEYSCGGGHTNSKF